MFWRHQLPNFENVALIARRREHFRGFLVIFFCCGTPSKEVLYYTRKIHSLLVKGVISASSHVL